MSKIYLYILIFSLCISAGAYIFHIQRQNGALSVQNEIIAQSNAELNKSISLIQERSLKEQEVLSVKHRIELENLSKEKETIYYVSSSDESDIVKLFNAVLNRLFD